MVNRNINGQKFSPLTLSQGQNTKTDSYTLGH